MRYKHTKEDLEKYVKECLSLTQLCRKLDITPKGGNYKTLKSKIKQWDIDISHFTGRGWNVGTRYRDVKRKISLSEIMIKNSTYTNTSNLRLKILKEGLKEPKCESCKLQTWLEKPIKIELHHKNGDHFDHRIENIEFLCPNCHAYTDNYRGKNINAGMS